MMMPMEMGPIRPPSEAHSLLIRIMENCPWNRCEFCSVYKGQRFAVRPVEDVKADIETARQWAENVRQVAAQSCCSVSMAARYNGIMWLDSGEVASAFLQDSDCLVVKTEQLIDIIKHLRGAFPSLKRVCSYARAKTLVKKKPEELAALVEAGLSRVHVGMESGDDEVLACVQKGATAAEMVEGGRKAVAAGFELSEYMMPGLGGKDRWEQHAVNSARVLSQIDPRFIRLRTLHLAQGTLLHEKAARGEFQVQTVEGLLVEVRRFIEELDVTSELIGSDFAMNYYMGEISGRLPEDRPRLLETVDAALARWRAHGEPKRNPFMRGFGLA